MLFKMRVAIMAMPNYEDPPHACLLASGPICVQILTQMSRTSRTTFSCGAAWTNTTAKCKYPGYCRLPPFGWPRLLSLQALKHMTAEASSTVRHAAVALPMSQCQWCGSQGKDGCPCKRSSACCSPSSSTRHVSAIPNQHFVSGAGPFSSSTCCSTLLVGQKGTLLIQKLVMQALACQMRKCSVMLAWPLLRCLSLCCTHHVHPAPHVLYIRCGS